MIDHASVAVSDVLRSKELYRAMLAPLGYELKMDLPDHKAAGFGTTNEQRSDFWLGEVSAPSSVHVAFVANSREMVDAFYKAGLTAGGQDNGAPGYRETYSPNYYGAFIHDFDGNNVEAVFRDPLKRSTV